MKQTATQKNGKNPLSVCHMRAHFPIFIYILFPSIFLTLALKNTIKENLQIQHQLKKKNHAVNLGKSSENWLEREVIWSLHLMDFHIVLIPSSTSEGEQNSQKVFLSSLPPPLLY